MGIYETLGFFYSYRDLNVFFFNNYFFLSYSILPYAVLFYSVLFYSNLFIYFANIENEIKINNY